MTKTFLALIFIVSQRANAFDFPLLPDSQVMTSFGEHQKTYLPQTFSLITWNIHKAQAGIQWVQEFQRVGSRANILMLQETYWIDDFRWGLAENPGFQWYSYDSFLWKGLPTGVMIGARSQLNDGAWFRSTRREPITETPKMSGMATTLLDDGQSVLLINTHGLNFTLTAPYREQIAPILKAIETHHGPVIWGGDFNTWNSNRRKWLLQQVASIGLTEVLPDEDPRLIALDRVFVRGLKVMRARILREYTSSDHWPFEIIFSAK